MYTNKFPIANPRHAPLLLEIPPYAKLDVLIKSLVSINFN